jgi:hypothetical protein
MSALLPHAKALRALGNALASAQVLEGLPTNCATHDILVRMAAAHLLAADNLEELIRAESGPDRRQSRRSDELRAAEAEASRCRNAMDASTFHGRERTRQAEERVTRLRGAE